jgi:hypothetical protein
MTAAPPRRRRPLVAGRADRVVRVWRGIQVGSGAACRDRSRELGNVARPAGYRPSSSSAKTSPDHHDSSAAFGAVQSVLRQEVIEPFDFLQPLRL